MIYLLVIVISLVLSWLYWRSDDDWALTILIGLTSFFILFVVVTCIGHGLQKNENLAETVSTEESEVSSISMDKVNNTYTMFVKSGNMMLPMYITDEATEVTYVDNETKEVKDVKGNIRIYKVEGKDSSVTLNKKKFKGWLGYLYNFGWDEYIFMIGEE